MKRILALGAAVLFAVAMTSEVNAQCCGGSYGYAPVSYGYSGGGWGGGCCDYGCNDCCDHGGRRFAFRGRRAQRGGCCYTSTCCAPVNTCCHHGHIGGHCGTGCCGSHGHYAYTSTCGSGYCGGCGGCGGYGGGVYYGGGYGMPVGGGCPGCVGGQMVMPATQPVPGGVVNPPADPGQATPPTPQDDT